jgi:hypothetical protein
MDAEGTVGDTVSELKQHDMSTYTTKKGSYIVPYTSLVTSSMMGKSRHMQTICRVCISALEKKTEGTDIHAVRQASPNGH